MIPKPIKSTLAFGLLCVFDAMLRPTFTVANAGESAVVGRWRANGTVNSHRIYYKSNGYFTKWDGVVTDPEQGIAVLEWAMYTSANQLLYYSAEDEQNPADATWTENHLVSGWGAAPEPTFA